MPQGGRELEIVVPFTTPASTQAALDEAGRLAQGLDFRIRLIAVQAIPLGISFEYPPVSLDYMKNALQDLSCVHPINREIYLSRDAEQTWKEVLCSRSLVLITPSKALWLSKERKLARVLLRQGQEVCYVRPLRAISGEGPASLLPSLTPASRKAVMSAHEPGRG